MWDSVRVNRGACHNSGVSTFKIAVMGRKGGVGKTSTAIHLAGHLGALGQRTLLIDGDDRQYATGWVRAAPEGKPMPFEVDGIGGLMRAAEYDAVVIDSEADPSEAEIGTLGRNTHVIVLPVVAERQAVDGLRQTVRTLDASGAPRARVRALLTMDTRRGSVTREAREGIEALGVTVLASTIRNTTLFRDASNDGVLIWRQPGGPPKMAWEDYRGVLRELQELAP